VAVEKVAVPVLPLPETAAIAVDAMSVEAVESKISIPYWLSTKLLSVKVTVTVLPLVWTTEMFDGEFCT
jgi:hypothetical protein